MGRNVGYVILLQGSHLRQRLPELLHHPVPQEYGASIVNAPYPRPLPCGQQGEIGLSSKLVCPHRQGRPIKLHIRQPSFGRTYPPTTPRKQHPVRSYKIARNALRSPRSSAHPRSAENPEPTPCAQLFDNR